MYKRQFLQKEREDDKKYSEEFFDGKGGNVITLQSYVAVSYTHLDVYKRQG